MVTYTEEILDYVYIYKKVTSLISNFVSLFIYKFQEIS